MGDCQSKFAEADFSSIQDLCSADSKCELIVTDSGRTQEEATVPCITKPVSVTRLSTEHPKAVNAGFAEIVKWKKGIF